VTEEAPEVLRKTLSSQTQRTQPRLDSAWLQRRIYEEIRDLWTLLNEDALRARLQILATRFRDQDEPDDDR
jgi:hypothetical protein